MALRVVLAEDSYLVREGVARLLATQPDVEVVAVCGNLFELLEAVDSAEPDVVVTDIRMPPSQSDEGIRAADRIRATRPDVGVFGARDLLPPRFVLATPEARRPGVATRPASCGARSRGARFEERVDLPRELVSRPAVGAA